MDYEPELDEPLHQEVRITLSIPINNSIERIVSIMKSLCSTHDWCLMQVEEERHIYGNSEDSDLPWVNND